MTYILSDGTQAPIEPETTPPPAPAATPTEHSDTGTAEPVLEDGVRVVEYSDDDDSDGDTPTDDETPPADGTADADTTTTDEPDDTDDDIDAVIARYKGDPKAMAKALKERQAVLDRQAAELGTLRKGATPPADAATPGTPAAPIGANDGAGDEGELPDVFLQPPPDISQFPIDDDTGYPLEDGVPIIPYDEYGVPKVPESVWERRAEKLSAQFPDNPVYASQLLQRERQKADAEYATEIQKQFTEAEKYKSNIIGKQTEGMAEYFGKQYPEPIAKALGSVVTGIASTVITEGVRTGRVHPSQAYSRAYIENTVNMVLADGYRNNWLEGEVAKIAAAQGTTPPKPGKQKVPAAPIGGNSHTNGNGAASKSNYLADRKISDAQFEKMKKPVEFTD